MIPKFSSEACGLDLSVISFEKNDGQSWQMETENSLLECRGLGCNRVGFYEIRKCLVQYDIVLLQETWQHSFTACSFEVLRKLNKAASLQELLV